jgi:XTP/dITP diphosphohydrolase
VRIVLATGNRDKVAELAPLFPGIEVSAAPDGFDVEETGVTLLQNAWLKAAALRGQAGDEALVVADDSGLVVHALGGRPGVFSSRYAGPDATYAENVDLLLRELTGRDDRSARFVTVIALAMPDGMEVAVEGALEGVIAREPRGTGGFGYDPVFEVDGMTLSEMGVGMKNKLSHRARAIRSLAAALGAEV